MESEDELVVCQDLLQSFPIWGGPPLSLSSTVCIVVYTLKFLALPTKDIESEHVKQLKEKSHTFMHLCGTRTLLCPTFEMTQMSVSTFSLKSPQNDNFYYHCISVFLLPYKTFCTHVRGGTVVYFTWRNFAPVLLLGTLQKYDPSNLPGL